jgi:hypothetical protein
MECRLGERTFARRVDEIRELEHNLSPGALVEKQ